MKLILNGEMCHRSIQLRLLLKLKGVFPIGPLALLNLFNCFLDALVVLLISELFNNHISFCFAFGTGPPLYFREAKGFSVLFDVLEDFFQFQTLFSVYNRFVNFLHLSSFQIFITFFDYWIFWFFNHALEPCFYRLVLFLYELKGHFYLC